jgi:hypothetical protein
LKSQIFIFLEKGMFKICYGIGRMQHTRKYIYLQHFIEKSGILIPDLYKNTNHKINTRENKRSYLFFLWGWVQPNPCGWAEPSRPSRVTGPNQERRETTYLVC